jgi:DNA-binding NarL/FixJ family response regulator
MRTTIITADDDKAFRSMLRSLLSQDEAFTVVAETDNGDDAVLAVRELHPDVVLLDITMPRANGFDAARRIKAYRPRTKIIILTVHANYEQAALESGADAFIAKKRLSSELLPTVRLLMRQTAEKTGAILLVDNDAQFRRATADGLRARIDAVIEECASSENDVLAKASALAPAVAAVDWEAAGPRIIKCLRRLFPHLAIVALTGADSERHREAIFAAGAEAAVGKDRLESDLLPILAALAQHRRVDPGLAGRGAEETEPAL